MAIVDVRLTLSYNYDTTCDAGEGEVEHLRSMEEELLRHDGVLKVLRNPDTHQLRLEKVEVTAVTPAPIREPEIIPQEGYNRDFF